MKTLIKVVLLLFFFTIIISCNSNPLEQPIPQGKRDYVWTLDTLYPSNFYTGMWGTSQNNVWLISEEGFPYDRLQHFDGTKWSVSNQPVVYSAGTIWGFSDTDIWITGGSSGIIQHFDGTKWNVSYQYKPEGSLSVTLQDIWGNSSNDIYAVGVVGYSIYENIQRGCILHYNGAAWKEIYLSKTNSQLLKIREQYGEKIILGTRLGIQGIDTLFLSTFDGNSLKEFYSCIDVEGCVFSTVGNELYYAIKKDILIYKDGSFHKKFSITEPYFNYGLWGRSENDIFISMYDGLVHYNGKDFQYLYKFNSTGITPFRAMIFDNTVFFLIHNYPNNLVYVLKGKLKE